MLNFFSGLDRAVQFGAEIKQPPTSSPKFRSPNLEFELNKPCPTAARPIDMPKHIPSKNLRIYATK